MRQRVPTWHPEHRNHPDNNGKRLTPTEVTQRLSESDQLAIEDITQSVLAQEGLPPEQSFIRRLGKAAFDSIANFFEGTDAAFGFGAPTAFPHIHPEEGETFGPPPELA